MDLHVKPVQIKPRFCFICCVWCFYLRDGAEQSEPSALGDLTWFSLSPIQKRQKPASRRSKVINICSPPPIYFWNFLFKKQMIANANTHILSHSPWRKAVCKERKEGGGIPVSSCQEFSFLKNSYTITWTSKHGSLLIVVIQICLKYKMNNEKKRK